MPFLLDDRLKEITSLIEGLESPARRFVSRSPSRRDLEGDMSAAIQQQIADRGFLSALKANGAYHDLDGTTPEFAAEVFALERLVALGDLTSAEADAYISQVYPSAKWSGGGFGDQTRAVAAQAISTALAGPQGGKLPGPLDVGRAAQDAEQTASAGQAGFQQVFVDGLPQDYNPRQVQDALQTAVDQVSGSIQELASGAVNFHAHSIDGRALKPGSVPVEALDSRGLGLKARPLPPLEDAIQVDLTPHRGMDRYVTMASTAISGPGRVYQAVAARLPSGMQPPTGAARYRIVKAGQRMGVLWARLTALTPVFELRYGFIVTGIQHWLGRVPSGLLSAGYLGDAPVANASVFDDGGTAGLWNNPKVLFHAHAESIYTTNPFPFASVFGSDATLAPVAADIEGCKGFVFSLITGRDSDEVYQQLNSLRVLGRGLREEGHGPTVTTPEGLDPLPAAPANVLNWNGTTGAGARFDHRTDADDLSTFTRVLQGCPFSPSDCAAMVPTRTRFSLVVQADFTRSVTPGGGSTWSSPEEWQNNGLETDGTFPREWGVDVILY
jgi:hypothetical protein